MSIIPQRFSFRHLGASLAVLFGVLLIVSWGVWYIAVYHYEKIVDELMQTVRSEGYQISYVDRRAFGFPHRISLRFIDLHWKSADGIEFRTPDIDIASVPWRWNAFDAHFKHGAIIEVPLDEPGQSLTLSSVEGRAHVELSGQQQWRLGHLNLKKAKLGRTPNYLFLVDNLECDATRPEMPPATHMEPGLTLSGSAADVTLPAEVPSPFGSKIEKLEVFMKVMGPVPDVRKKSDVSAWNKDVGVVQFDHLDMNWGPLALKSHGIMGFDDDLQPEGSFSTLFGGQEAVLKAMADSGLIAPRQAGMLQFALAQAATQFGEESKKEIEIPMAIQLGNIFFGPVRIFSFPPIEWQEGEDKNNKGG